MSNDTPIKSQSFAAHGIIVPEKPEHWSFTKGISKKTIAQSIDDGGIHLQPSEAQWRAIERR